MCHKQHRLVGLIKRYVTFRLTQPHPKSRYQIFAPIFCQFLQAGPRQRKCIIVVDVLASPPDHNAQALRQTVLARRRRLLGLGFQQKSPLPQVELGAHQTRLWLRQLPLERSWHCRDHMQRTILQRKIQRHFELSPGFWRRRCLMWLEGYYEHAEHLLAGRLIRMSIARRLARQR